MGERGQQNTESIILWQALSRCSLLGVPVWISLSPPPGDSAKTPGPLQSLPSFFKAALTVSVLCAPLYLLYYEHSLYYVAEMSNCPTNVLSPALPFPRDHRDGVDGGKWLPRRRGLPAPHPCVATWLVLVNGAWAATTFCCPCLASCLWAHHLWIWYLEQDNYIATMTPWAWGTKTQRDKDGRAKV